MPCDTIDAKREPRIRRMVDGETRSALASHGIRPGVATENWHALPTHTLRFAECWRSSRLRASRSTNWSSCSRPTTNAAATSFRSRMNATHSNSRWTFRLERTSSRSAICGTSCSARRPVHLEEPGVSISLAVDGGATANGTATRATSDAKSFTSPRRLDRLRRRMGLARVEKVLHEELGFALMTFSTWDGISSRGYSRNRAIWWTSRPPAT